MKAISELAQNTSVLFARTARSAELVILPVNNSAGEAPDGRIPAFYCVHSVSGSAGTDFLELARHLDPDIRFYGIQAPPKQIVDARFGESIEALAGFYSDALVQFQPEGPILLGGYCVGAVIALAMAQNLRARGRHVGPLIAIDGAPENFGTLPRRWTAAYIAEMARNVPGWFRHADLMREWSMRSLIWSITNNASAVGKRAIGLRRGEKWGGGYAIDGVMDVSRYHQTEKSFINRLFAALFAYTPERYAGEVVVYEASVTPLLYLPHIGRIWRELAPAQQVVRIIGTHISMMRSPYVLALATDLRQRITAFLAAEKH